MKDAPESEVSVFSRQTYVLEQKTTRQLFFALGRLVKLFEFMQKSYQEIYPSAQFFCVVLKNPNSGQESEIASRGIYYAIDTSYEDCMGPSNHMSFDTLIRNIQKVLEEVVTENSKGFTEVVATSFEDHGITSNELGIRMEVNIWSPQE